MAGALRAITAARLVDGTGGPSLDDPVVICEGDRIRTVGPRGSTPIPPAAEVLDLGDRTLLPGLIDAHTHFYIAGSDSWITRSIEPSQRKLIRAVVDAARLLEEGFTSIRDMGYRDSIYIKQAIEDGDIPGPRMVAPRMMIIQTGGSPDPHWLPVAWVEQYDYRCRLADGIDEVRKAAREQLRDGADFLKVMASGGLTTGPGNLAKTYHYTLDELKALVEEARKAATFVAAHAIGAAAVKNAVRAGATTIEHGSYIDDEALDLMAEHDIIFVPTLAINWTIANSDPSGTLAGTISISRAMYEDTLKQVEQARARGVRIAAGTDFGGLPMSRHGPNAIEAELLTNGGLTPDEAVVAATRRGAEAMGRADQLGTVEPGKYADLVALDTNPLDDIRALRQVSFVMKGGQVVREDRGGHGRSPGDGVSIGSHPVVTAAARRLAENGEA